MLVPVSEDYASMFVILFVGPSVFMQLARKGACRLCLDRIIFGRVHARSHPLSPCLGSPLTLAGVHAGVHAGAGEMLAGVRGAKLRDVQLLHRPDLRAGYRRLPPRSSWQASFFFRPRMGSETSSSSSAVRAAVRLASRVECPDW